MLLPEDPKALLDLLDLRDKLIIQKELNTNLDKYVSGFLQGHIYSAEQAVKYIPTEQHDAYRKDRRDFKTLLAELRDYEMHARWNRGYFQFLLDTQNKKYHPYRVGSGGKFTYDLVGDKLSIKLVDEVYHKFPSYMRAGIRTYNTVFNVRTNVLVSHTEKWDKD